jgi:hypothetical protein
MIVEEHVGDDATLGQPQQSLIPAEMEVEEADGLDEPQQPAMFETFLVEHGGKGDTDAPHRESSTRKRSSERTPTVSSTKRNRAAGPMSKYFK